MCVVVCVHVCVRYIQMWNKQILFFDLYITDLKPSGYVMYVHIHFSCMYDVFFINFHGSPISIMR